MHPQNEIAEKLNQEFLALSASQRIGRVAEFFGDGLAFSTSLGMEDQALTDLIARNQFPVNLFTLDTGRLFQETYDLMQLTRERYQLAIDVYFPKAENIQSLLSQKGPNSFYESVENRKECCFLRKVEPLHRALKNATVWITGLRAEQSENRQDLKIISWEEEYQLYKVNPLLDWSEKELMDYINEYRVPINELHKTGFPSIGCAPCTRAVQAGENIRAGRWWWESSHKECGLHSTPDKI